MYIANQKLEGHHILSIKDLSHQDIEAIFSIAENMEPMVKEGRRIDLLKDRILATLLLPSSTRTRLSRVGDPKELVGTTVFLASTASDLVTGHILVVDADSSI